jgi:HAD superfamily hydrolase (TIGR01549 family)/HAD superfamily hydrolase (TIGR01509 family)
MTSTPPSPPTGLQRRPVGLLLDFGGVLFQTTKRPTGRTDAATMLSDVLQRAGHDVSAVRLHRSLDAGLGALKDWKNSAGRRREPAELTPREIWTDFLASDLPDAVRATLAADAAGLLDRITPLLSDHDVRPGALELLRTAAVLGVRVGIVSNAHSGRAHRALLARHGLADFIAVQVYSDEVGMRKPSPRMITLAAEALGTTAEQCWYVGDTLDRDVVAGRRAAVGAVVLTRSKHTDDPPYPVEDTADAIYDTPEGLVAVLRDSIVVDAAPAAAVLAAVPERSAVPAGPVAPPAAILLDHGGVIATSVKDPAAQRRFGFELAKRMRRAGLPAADDTIVTAIETARFRHRQWKDTAEGAAEVPEISPREFWCDLVGAGLEPAERAWLRAEAAQLSFDYAGIKSSTSIRPGLRELLERARAAGIPVGIVSNTLSGRAVRQRLVNAGIEEHFAVQIYSDELGRRKPDPSMPGEVLTALGVNAADCWFVGDKPDRDMAAAHFSGIRTAILVRGGSLDEAGINRAAAAPGPEQPDLIVDSLVELDALLDGALATALARRTHPSTSSAFRSERALP